MNELPKLTKEEVLQAIEDGVYRGLTTDRNMYPSEILGAIYNATYAALRDGVGDDNCLSDLIVAEIGRATKKSMKKVI